MSAHKKVMIVDDEESVRVSFNRYLSTHGFDVLTVEDGGDAISRLRAEAVDVVVADLKMPRVDGMELLRWMHDERPDTPFILLTGYGNDEVEQTSPDFASGRGPARRVCGDRAHNRTDDAVGHRSSGANPIADG